MDQPIEDKAEHFVAEYQSAYAEALTEARQAADTTKTIAWRNLFASASSQHRQDIEELANSIIASAKAILDFDSNEKKEKDLSDAVKEIKEERKRHEAFYRRTAEPLAKTAAKCKEILATADREAKRREDGAPLYDEGFRAAVKRLTDKWPRADWDETTGVIAILPAPAEGQGDKSE